jgi:hypothetical protein
MDRRVSTVLVLATLVSATASTDISASSRQRDGHPRQVTAVTGIPSRPLTFTENHGQWHELVRFKAKAAGATMWVTARGVHYQFSGGTPEAEPFGIATTFAGANPSPNVVGEGLTAHRCNFFLGSDPAQWRTGVPSYRAVVFERLYDGIDLKYYGNGQRMEYDFVVAPGADVAQIVVRYEGVVSLSVGAAGDLRVGTARGMVTERAPLAYQMVRGRIQPISAAYRVVSERAFGFELGGDYDPGSTVFIDPVLQFSTYLGGGGDDFAKAVAVDGDQNIYVAGHTYSTDFPSQSAIQGPGGLYDAFITKFDRWGDLVYSTYLGGGGGDRAYSIAVDDSGHAYVTGATASTYFPTKNPYKDGPLLCDGDAFVSKLSVAGDSLIFSTYLGGSDVDWGIGIAVDDAGFVYVAGMAQSADFPTVNPYQTFQGARDATVTKFDPSGGSLVYSTYLGGSAIDNTWAMALGADGSVYITGETQSGDYPTVNAYQSDQGNQDVFLSKLHPSGGSLVYSTYLGGGSMDVGTGVAVDGSGCAFVTGWTQSFDFPLQDPYQNNRGYDDVFVTKFNATGDGLVYSTYLGGDSYDIGWGIDVDAGGRAWVAGWTRSANFPTLDPYQTHQDTTDAFLVELTPAGDAIDYGTYLGGDGADEAWALALDADGNAYVAGNTESTDFPAQIPYQAYQGAKDAFVAKFSVSAVSVRGGAAPGGFRLHQNVPNPFNPVTTICYEVPRGGAIVTISVYDAGGRFVRTLIAGAHSSGPKTIEWDGRDERGRSVSSGVYFCRMSAAGLEQTIKMVVLR